MSTSSIVINAPLFSQVETLNLCAGGICVRPQSALATRAFVSDHVNRGLAEAFACGA